MATLIIHVIEINQYVTQKTQVEVVVREFHIKLFITGQQRRKTIPLLFCQ